jgi:type II secretory pathway component PulF
MATYSYRAIDPSSNILVGKIVAQDESVLEKTLGMQGLTLIEAKKSLGISWSTLSTPRFRETDLLNLTYLMQQIVISGISLVTGLQDVVDGGSRKILAPVFLSLSSGVQSGMSLSEAMLERPDVFPSYYIQMIRAGEVSGTLEQSLDYLMQYLDWQIEFKKSIRSMLVYPTIVLSFMGFLIIILFVFVFPALIGVLTSLKADLPLPTRVVMAISNFARNYSLYIGTAAVAAVAAYRLLTKRPAIRRIVDNLQLKLPLAGELISKISLSRYFKTLATLQASGLDIQSTFSTAAGVVNNTELRARLEQVTESILSGGTVAGALIATGSIPQLVLSMVSLGEKTGNIEGALFRSSNIFDKEVRETVKRLFAAVEPLIVICLGAMMLVILLSIFLPLYGIIGSIKGH